MTTLPEKELPQKKTYISREEEYELIRAYQKTGDEEVYEKLQNAHKKYIRSCAEKESKRTGVDIDDLYQEACLQFRKAIVEFKTNHKSQVRLLSYATHKMDEYMNRYAHKNRTTQTTSIRMSPKDQKIMKKYNDLLKKWGKENRSELLEPEEIAAIEKELGHTLEEVAEIQTRYYAPTTSLNAFLPGSEKEITTFLDMLPETRPNPMEWVAEKSDFLYLLAVFNRANLSPKEKKVIKLVYFQGEAEEGNLAEIGRSMNLTKERIRQLKNTAIEKMKITSDHMQILAEEKLIEAWPAPLPALTRK